MRTINHRANILITVLFSASFLAPQLYAAEATHPPAQFKDTCHCVDCHGEYRWEVKTDDEPPPAGVLNNNPVTPSQIGNWDGPGGIFTKTTPRRIDERKWWRVTGRVTLVKIEPDGDLHIQLVDENAEDDDVNVVVEVPFGHPWCDIRKVVFGWTNQTFPFQTQGKKFSLNTKPVITVTGKAFYDAIHGGKDTSLNRRKPPPNAAPTTKHVTIWEIHPVMHLQVHGE